MKENPIQKRILLRCGHGLTRLFRMNIGKTWIGKSQYYNRSCMVKINQGDVVIRQARRFISGIKGMSDLIGWHSVVITPEMVGQKIAVYTAIEVKTRTGRPTSDQAMFILNVRAAGGSAGIARSPEEAEDILTEIE